MSRPLWAADYFASFPEHVITPEPQFFSEQISAARRFYLNLKPKRTRELTVVCGGWEECAPDYEIRRDDFPYFALEFVAEGAGEVRLGDRTYALGPGTVFTYGPRMAHVIRASAGARMGKYFVDFRGDAAARLLRQRQLSPGNLVTVAAIPEVRLAFDTLVRMGVRYDRHAPRATALQLELLLIAIDRARRPEARSGQLAYAAFLRCREQMHKQFLQHRTVESVAEACHIDPSYLSRLFRRFQRQTPYQFLQQLQMQWAASRLDGANRIVREVAEEIGMDPFQFSRVFKRVHGVSPSSFLRVRV